MKRATMVIPNENILDVPFYCKDINEGEFHGLGVKIFSNQYKLGITATSLGLEEEEYPGYVWQMRLTSLGHAVVCVGDCEPLMVFLPNKISENQYHWFQEQQSFFLKNRKYLQYLVIDNNENILEQTHSNTLEQAFTLMYAALAIYRGRENKEFNQNSKR